MPTHIPVRILEIGAGTGGTTHHLMSVLPPERTEYFFTDVSPLFITRAQKKFANYPFIQYRTLDITQDPLTQGFHKHQFQIVIAANVLHATPRLREALHNVKQVLEPGGILLLLEATEKQRLGDLTVGLTEGWWSFADQE